MKTNFHNLSTGEVEILDFIQVDHNIALVDCSDRIQESSFFKGLIFQFLSAGKVLVIRSSKKSEVIERLHKWGLENLVLDLNKSTMIDQSMVTDYKSDDNNLAIDAVKANIRYKNLVTQLHQLQSHYNEPVFSDYTRNKINELLFLSKRRKIDYKLDLDISVSKYQFTPKEFWDIRGKIEKAAKYYKTSYHYLKFSDEFQDNVYKDFHLSKNQAVIFQYLNKFLNDAEDIAKKYRETFESISNELYNKYKQEISVFSKLTNDLEIFIEYYKVESELAPKNSLFNKHKAPLEKARTELRSRYQLLIDAIRQSNLLKVTCPENHWSPKIDELHQFTIELQSRLANIHSIIKTKVEEQIEILNANNFSAPELETINTQQQELIYAINGSHLFTEEIHNMGISSWKNYGLIRSLMNRLRKAKLFLESNMDFAIYRSFEFSLEGKVAKLLDALSNVKQQSWIECYEAWYFKALFEHYYIHEINQLEHKFDQLTEYKYENEQYENFRLKWLFDQRKFGQNQLTKKLKKSDLDWKSAVLLSPEVFRSNFPIVLCDEDFFASEVANLPYDYLVCLENKEIPLNLFANSHFEGLLVLQKVLPQQMISHSKSAKNYKNVKRFQLKSKWLDASLDFANGHTGKLKLGQFLTRVLLETKFEKKFYSAKNFSVISCMSNFCNQLLEIEMLERKIKSLKFTSVESGIVDDIMIKDDLSKYLIIQDGFLDPSIDLEWQISTIRTLRQAGIKVISLNSFDLAQSESGQVLDLLQIEELKTAKDVLISHER